MKKLTSFSIALSLAFTSACSHSRIQKDAKSQDEIVVAEGVAPYRAEDIPGTKAASLAAAQRAAVELVVGVYVDAKTQVSKAVAIEQRILTQTQGYVKKYEILEERRDGEWYKTKIRALVATGQLRQDLDAAGLLRQAGIGNPRVALLIQEWVGEKRIDGGSATQTLTQGFLNKGFHVVEMDKAPADEDPVDLARSMSRGKAELLVVGLARAQSLGYGSKELGGLSSFRSSVTFRVIEVGSGEILKTVSETASGLEATPDLSARKSLSNAAEAAVKDINDLPEELSKRSMLNVTILGLTDFSTLSKFEEKLRKQSGVQDFFLRSFNQANGLAVLDVQTAGTAPQDLADQCVQIGGEGWSVYQVTGHSIQVSATPAGR